MLCTVLAVLGGIFLILIAVVLLRALCFRPKKEEPIAEIAVEYEKEKAVDALAQLIRCRTVSSKDSHEEDEEEFQKLLSLLPELYPNLCRICTRKAFEGRGVLFHWKGKNNGEPAVLMAHYDVVDAEESAWEMPPFSGLVENGILHGRGAVDTKVTFNGALFAAESLIKEGYVPENDVYFAFSGGEEVSGPGAENIKNYLKAQGITPALVVDEGGVVAKDIFPGVSGACALVGIAEKGMIDLEYSVKSEGGHASAPAAVTPIGLLSNACCKIEKHPFPTHLTKPVAEMFDTLGRHSGFLYRIVFANMWLFGGLFGRICRKSGGNVNALMRTTVAFTQMEGSDAANVMPANPKMVSNIRLNPADSVKSAMARIEKTVNCKKISLCPLYEMEPSRISDTACPGWQKLKNAVRGTWRDAVVSPYLMVQCSDSRCYDDISNRVYRFSAVDVTLSEIEGIHGNNEQIHIDAVCRAVEFYLRLLKQC